MSLIEILVAMHRIPISAFAHLKLPLPATPEALGPARGQADPPGRLVQGDRPAERRPGGGCEKTRRKGRLARLFRLWKNGGRCCATRNAMWPYG